MGTPTRRRVLFVDPLCQNGHLAFNRTYIRRLRELDVELGLVLAPDYAETLGAPRELLQLALPPALMREDVGPVRARLQQLRVLTRLRRQVDLAAWDHVVFSSYEEIALALAPPRGRLWLINHANIAGLDSPLKRPFLLAAARRGTFIVLHDFIRRRCTEAGITDVRVETNGVPAPHPMPPERVRAVLPTIDPRLAPGRFRHLVFAPASRFDSPFLREAVADPAVGRFLAERNALLVVRLGGDLPPSPNVLVLRRWLTPEEYQSLFLGAACILLHYPPAFRYRVSALLFECFANGRPCVAADIEAFRVFQPHFTYAPFYRDRDGLLQALETALAAPWGAGGSPYRDLDRLTTPSLDYLAA